MVSEKAGYQQTIELGLCYLVQDIVDKELFIFFAILVHKHLDNVFGLDHLSESATGNFSFFYINIPAINSIGAPV